MANRRPTSSEVDPWDQFLADRGLKSTVSRRAILAAFFNSRGHVSLADIQDGAREEAPRTGMATVYRTMKLLDEAGLVKRHEFRGEASRYETALGRDDHDHFICQECEIIIEFESPEIERLQEEVALAHGFDIRSHRHELYGLCARCRGTARLPAG